MLPNLKPYTYWTTVYTTSQKEKVIIIVHLQKQCYANTKQYRVWHLPWKKFLSSQLRLLTYYFLYIYKFCIFARKASDEPTKAQVIIKRTTYFIYDKGLDFNLFGHCGPNPLIISVSFLVYIFINIEWSYISKYFFSIARDELSCPIVKALGGPVPPRPVPPRPVRLCLAVFLVKVYITFTRFL